MRGAACGNGKQGTRRARWVTIFYKLATLMPVNSRQSGRGGRFVWDASRPPRLFTDAAIERGKDDTGGDARTKREAAECDDLSWNYS